MTDDTFIEIKKEELLGKAEEFHKDGYGLSMISVSAKDGFELIYCFEKGYQMINLRFKLAEGEEIESVSPFYPYSYVYENEAKEHFGIKINNIKLDFQGHLFKKAVERPFAEKHAEKRENG
jgi:ech hydrogenase subunit D